MSHGRPLRIAIVGGGVTGSTLGTLLAEGGADVTLFHDARLPQLVVGESLVPAIVPVLRRLGIEEDVKTLGLHKPGVTFAWAPGDHFRFSFARFPRLLRTPYAYNVPRPGFDALLLARARRAGVREVNTRAEVVRGEHPLELRLANQALAAAPELRTTAPDLIVDATGRRRTFARLLDLPVRVGPRNDVAHFAHFDGFAWDEPPGQVLISRLREGWSWRIPLRDRLSVGIVLDRAAAARLGATPTERLERAIREDPAFGAAATRARRLTDVVTYNNYQLITPRAFGPSWVLAGDALGFVDPMLSPGVFLGMHSAELLAAALEQPMRRCAASGTPGDLAAPLERYTRRMEHILSAWMALVETVYDGTLLGLFRAGSGILERRNNLFTRAIERHVGAHFAAMASGTRTTSPYSRGLLRFLGRHGLHRVDRSDFAVR
jgi:flavin-dependent dehydrogenase